MKHLRPFLAVFFVVAIVLGSTGIVLADTVQVGKFQVDLNGWEVSPSWDRAQNDGFALTWFPYPQPTLPTWWNQWFYDGNLVIPGGKIVNIGFDWKPIDPLKPATFHITLNWSNTMWQEGQGTPPVPGAGYNPEDYIGRSDYITFEYEPGTIFNGHYQSGDFLLPIPFNPEWVSVDVRGTNVNIFNGIIEHRCVPLPGALLLLGSGLIGLVGLRKKIMG